MCNRNYLASSLRHGNPLGAHVNVYKYVLSVTPDVSAGKESLSPHIAINTRRVTSMLTLAPGQVAF